MIVRFRRGCACDQRLQQFAQRRVRRRHKEAHAGFAQLHQFHRVEKRRADQRDLRAPAARQHRDDRAAFGEPQFAARTERIRLDRDFVGERMADVSRRDARLFHQRDFERKHAQHVIDGLHDLLDAPAAPRPDRRTHEMHGRNARVAQRMFEPEIEIGRIDADEHRRRLGQQLPLQLVADAENLGNVLERLDIAAHGQLVHRPVGVEAGGRHARAADAAIVRRGGQPLLEPAEQRRREQVAGRLARDHRDAQGDWVTASFRRRSADDAALRRRDEIGKRRDGRVAVAACRRQFAQLRPWLLRATSRSCRRRDRPRATPKSPRRKSRAGAGLRR